MYEVLLLDDEPWALVGIRKVFKWAERGFIVVSETTNPVEAFDVICEQQPDVVFTDIRMPEISGLELMQKTREKGLDTEFIVVSGFAEFSYAQEAIRQGAFDYLLKPLQLESTDALLRKLEKHLGKKQKRLSGKEIEVSVDRIDSDVNENFVKLLNFVNQHYDMQLSLKALSNQYFINYTYCCELFKKVTGKHFSEYITDLRMNKASDYLTKTTLSVNEISEKVGFRDYFYFNKVFKKVKGTTPIKYRNNSRETK